MPSVPGVYLFTDKENNPLYIGKSNNLRARISSYFRSEHLLATKTKLFREQSTRLTVVPTISDFEAILLEARLVKLFIPKYNIQLKDDKSPIYIAITHEDFPKVLLMRKADLDQFPMIETFGPFLSAKQAETILKKVRRIIPFCNKGHAFSGKPCFWWHLGLCPGVCTGTITKRQYAVSIRRILQLLSGKLKVLQKDFSKEMRRASQAHEYERAARVRDALAALNHMRMTSLPQGGAIIGENEQKKRTSELRKLLDQSNISFDESRHIRIEGYDVSTLGGRSATASMVVFLDGVPDKSQYRRFKIHAPVKTDDFRMITEAVRRRLLHPEWDKPDLVVIDGGAPQLSQIQRELKIGTHLPGNIPFIGLVKGIEKVVVPTKEGFGEIIAERSHPGLQLLIHVRDEAHRFARVYHHWLRGKALTE